MSFMPRGRPKSMLSVTCTSSRKHWRVRACILVHVFHLTDTASHGETLQCGSAIPVLTSWNEGLGLARRSVTRVVRCAQRNRNQLVGLRVQNQFEPAHVTAVGVSQSRHTSIS